MPEKPPLDKEEFLALSDQKADDWREITRISSSFLGIAGAFFTAGVARSSSWVIVVSPIPLLLGVLHMTRNARLQLQMITYLAVFSPFLGSSWEKDVARVRPHFWQISKRGRVASRVARLRRIDGPSLARHLSNPSVWDAWLLVAAVTSVGVDAIPLMMGFPDKWPAVWVGLGILAVGITVIVKDIARIEPERKRWHQLWSEYKQGELDHLP